MTRHEPEGDPIIDLELLPESLDFERLVEKNAKQRLTLWSTEEKLEIDGSRLPGALTEGFFFPERTCITSSQFELSEYLATKPPMWHFQATFTVEGGFEYRIHFNNQASEKATVSAEDFNGNTITSEIEGIEVLQFLLVLYNEHLNKTRDGKPVNIIDLMRSRRQYQDIDNSTFSRILLQLGDLSGCTQVRTMAEIPYPKGNRTIFALLSKKIMPEQEIVDVDIDIASEVDNARVPIERVILHSSASTPPIESDGLYAQISRIDIPLDSFPVYREVPELLSAATTSFEQIDSVKDPTRKLKSDPRLFKLSMACMSILSYSMGEVKPEQP